MALLPGDKLEPESELSFIQYSLEMNDSTAQVIGAIDKSLEAMTQAIQLIDRNMHLMQTNIASLQQRISNLENNR